MKKVFLIGAAVLLAGTASTITYVNAQPPSDDPRAQVAQDNRANAPKGMGKEMREKGMEKRDRMKGGREEVPDNIRQELKDFHEKKKALREGLSPEAKEVLKKRHDNRKDKRDHMEDRMDHREDVRDNREDRRDRMEDRMDRKHDGGAADRMEDRRDRREDKRDYKEDRKDRREDKKDKAPKE